MNLSRFWSQELLLLRARLRLLTSTRRSQLLRSLSSSPSPRSLRTSRLNSLDWWVTKLHSHAKSHIFHMFGCPKLLLWYIESPHYHITNMATFVTTWSQPSLIFTIWLMIYCCIFWPALGCCTLQTLVKIGFSMFFTNKRWWKEEKAGKWGKIKQKLFFLSFHLDAGLRILHWTSSVSKHAHKCYIQEFVVFHWKYLCMQHFDVDF